MYIRKSDVYIFVYVLVFVFLFPGLTLYVTEQSAQGRGLLTPVLITLGCAVTIYSALRLIFLSRSCPENMTGITFFIFVYIWLGLTPLYQIGIGQIPWGIVLDREVYEKTYFVVFVAIAAFELGYNFRSRAVLSWRRDEPQISRGRIICFSLIATLPALWFGPLTQPLPVLLSFREEVAAAMGEDSFVLVRLALMRTPIYVAFLIILWKLRVQQRRDPGLLVLLAVVFPLFLIVNFPTAISRAWLGALIISIALVVFLTSEKKSFRYFPLLLPVGLLTIFPFMHRFRRADYEPEGALLESVVSTYSKGDFDAFAMTAHFVNYTDSVYGSITYGRQLLGTLFFWVPRQFWPSKPVGSGYHVAEQSGFQFYNVSAPLWAEGLINFSLVGVIGFMVSLGLLLRFLDLKVCLSRDLTATNLAYVFVSGFLFIILRGDLNTVAGFVAPFLLCVIFLRMGFRTLR